MEWVGFLNGFWCGLVSVVVRRVGGGLVSVNAAIIHSQFWFKSYR